MLLGFYLFLAQSVQAEEEVTDGNKAGSQNTDPHQDAAHTLGFQIHKEVGVNQRSGGGGDQNGGIELQNSRLDQQEGSINQWEGDGSDGLIPLALTPLVK